MISKETIEEVKNLYLKDREEELKQTIAQIRNKWCETKEDELDIVLNIIDTLQQEKADLVKWLEDKIENHNKIIKAKEKDLKKWKEEFPHCDEKQTITYSQLRHLRYENDVYQEILDKVKENK